MKFIENSELYNLNRSTYVNLRWIAFIGQIFAIFVVEFILEFKFNYIPRAKGPPSTRMQSKLEPLKQILNALTALNSLNALNTINALSALNAVNALNVLNALNAVSYTHLTLPTILRV